MNRELVPCSYSHRYLCKLKKMNKLIIILVSAFTLGSCTAVKVAVPDQFSSQATKMKVYGLNGWKFNEQLSFGTYVTSTVQRGWDFSSGNRFTRFSIKPEDIILSAFDIHSDKARFNEKNRFQYTIQDAKLITEIFAQEKFSEKQIIYKSNLDWLNNISQTNSYDYAFSATIVPLNFNKGEAWSLVMVNQFDAKKDKQKLFERPQTRDLGYATNGKDRIEIKPLYLSKRETPSGKEGKVLGGPIHTGYELKWEDGVVGIIDIMDNQIWIVNDLEASDKMIISSLASAILLKRKQDVFLERDSGIMQ